MTNLVNHRPSAALAASERIGGTLAIIALAQPNSGIAAAAVSSQASGAGGHDIFHVAIFRFAKEHVNDAMAAFHALASVSR